MLIVVNFETIANISTFLRVQFSRVINFKFVTSDHSLDAKVKHENIKITDLNKMCN